MNNCNEEKEDIYMLMGPNTASDKDDRQYDYVRMPGTGVNTNRKQTSKQKMLEYRSLHVCYIIY